jgi:hypothetical protein
VAYRQRSERPGPPLGAQGFLLDNLRDDERVPHTPVGLLHILVLVVVIEDDHGHHLLLRMLPYDEEGPDGHGFGGGSWALPFTEHPVSHDGPPLHTVGEVRKILDGSSKWNQPKHGQKEAVKAAWNNGLIAPEVRALGEMTVLKPSIRVPDHWLAIRFHPYLAWTDVDAGLHTLADPEAKRGLVYLPLDDLDAVVARRQGGEEWWYRGKPIAFEVAWLLGPERRGRLKDHSVRLRADHFSRTEEGLIVVADLAGWGRALQAAGQPRNAIGVTGPSNVHQFVDHTNAAYHRFLSRIGPSYEQHSGDGILAVFHARSYDLADVLSRLLPGWRTLLAHVEPLNEYLQDAGIVIGSRLAIHHDSYRYGRTGQALSHSAAVTGEGIVKAARLEQGLANWVREEGGSARPGTTLRHTLAVSMEALDRHAEALNDFHSHLDSLGDHRLSAKESDVDAHVWRVNV